jgi:hypothetical protein
MSESDGVARVCRLPVDFYEGGSKSMLQLVAESGIRANLTQLAVPRIMHYLEAHSELIEQWLRWSANKRVTSGWYFTSQAGAFVVGFHPNGEVLNFADPALACAEFVVREVSALARMLRPGN